EMSQGLVRGCRKFRQAVIRELKNPLRAPAFFTPAIKLRREGALWGLKALLHVFCKPAVDGWRQAMKYWKAPTDPKLVAASP
ncbi:MAG TPA: hypothetical protein VGL91_18635, partial [Acidobacteriota bacterium]